MELLTSYNLIIAASIILILSFWFNGVAKKTNIPPVLMLIALGVILQYVLLYFVKVPLDFFPLLEVLGIIGLIMIVLEAALELELKREKLWPILRSLAIALIGLLGSAYVAAQILYYFIPEMTLHSAWLYATTLSILSSAIIIPSVGGLTPDKKEFHIYESIFSDILGIIIGTSLIMTLAMIRDKRKIGTTIDEFDKEYRARDESYAGIAYEGHTVPASPVMEALPDDPIKKNRILRSGSLKAEKDPLKKFFKANSLIPLRNYLYYAQILWKKKNYPNEITLQPSLKSPRSTGKRCCQQ